MKKHADNVDLPDPVLPAPILPAAVLPASVLAVLALVALVLLMVASTAFAQQTAPDTGTTPDDGFIAGYAAAVLERELQLPSTTLRVSDGTIYLASKGLGPIERQRVVSVLAGIRGVRQVQFVEAPSAGQATTGRTETGESVTGGADTGQATPRPNDASLPPAFPPGAYAPPPGGEPTAFLAPARLFEPLLADPRWPHFYASYLSYSKDAGNGLNNAGAVGFGESIAFLRRGYDDGSRLELGLQAGVFAAFDLDAESKDLVNADYFVGPLLAYRRGNLSLLGRLYHQSSHLGDEFLLRTNTDRINLSYEVIDALVSYEFGPDDFNGYANGLRIYGGGGYLINTDPEDIDPGLAQYGLEWRSPRTYFNNAMRPVAAADFQHRDETDWNLDTSLRLGVQFEDPDAVSRRIQLLFEYYNGQSPNGQFFDERIEYFGLGLHFYF